MKGSYGKGKGAFSVDTNGPYGYDESWWDNSWDWPPQVNNVNLGDDEELAEDEEWVKVKKARTANLVERRKEINEVKKEERLTTRQGEWENITVQVDSGAQEWVTPKETRT